MRKPIFITGTDTDVGKTIASCWLSLQLAQITKSVSYWKPVQSGLEPETDTDRFLNLTGFSKDQTLPERWRLTEPLSPHEAARRDGVEIQLEDFNLPKTDGPLLIEGAGGLMVPLNDKDMMIDLISYLKTPVVLVTRSGLGTINHTLLSLEALRKRSIPLLGLIINGAPSPHNYEALREFGQVPVLAHIPQLKVLDKASLLYVEPLMDLKNLQSD